MSHQSSAIKNIYSGNTILLKPFWQMIVAKKFSAGKMFR